MTNLSITKSNALIKASYRLSLNEMRVVIYGLSLINPMKQEFPIAYEIDIKHFAQYFGINPRERGFYKEIKRSILDKFWEREMSYWDKRLDRIVKERWLIRVEYNDKEGIIKVYFNPMLSEQLQQLRTSFTTYFLSNIIEMKSVYGIRLYEIAIMELKRAEAQNESLTVTTFKMSIEKIKFALQITDKYKRFNQLKEYVLERAKTEINKYSNIKMKYEIVKRGRTPYEIIFLVKKKEKTAKKAINLLPNTEDLDNQLSFNFKNKKK